MPNFQTSTAAFLRYLLEQCIGTVMIEAEQWDFPEPTFDRGYFNQRLKHKNAINRLAHERLNFVFSHLLNPQNRNSRFQEPQAVEAANRLIGFFQDQFQIDCTRWINQHTRDNHAARTHLLFCLDKVLSLCEGEYQVPAEEIHRNLQQYLDQVHVLETIQPQAQVPANAYPSFLSAAPYGQAEHFVGRTALAATIADALIAGISVCLYGIGGIGKTEIAKAVLKLLYHKTADTTGIRQILWVNNTQENFARSLLHALSMNIDHPPLEIAFPKALQLLQQYRSQLLLVIDNVEWDTDPYLLHVTEYLDCRILLTSRIDGFPHLYKILVPPLSVENCRDLFYFFYHGGRDDTTLCKITALADRHTNTIELLAKIADTEEVSLCAFLENLIRCGFRISKEEACTSHEKLCSEGKILEQLQKLFRIYGCTKEETLLLLKIAAIPALPFQFEQAKKWFGISNRTILNRLVKRGWLKKDALYDGNCNRYCYVIHTVIASAVRAQQQEQLYPACQNFIYEIITEIQNRASDKELFPQNFIHFTWSLNDIFSLSYG